MKQVLIFIALLAVGYVPVFGQDHYDRAKALSSEEVFLKSNPVNRIITQPGQKYLILDSSPTLGVFHRYRFFPGDLLKFRMKNETIRFNEPIAGLTDSTLTIATINEAAVRMDYQIIPLKEIKLVKTYKRIPFISQMAPIFPLAGLLYVGADFFNRGVDNKRFTTDGSTIAVGGAFVIAGIISYKLTFSTLKINKKNKLKVIETY